MKIKQVLDKLIENWQVKAVCFVLSLFLYVIYQNQSVDRKVFSVPLTVEAKNGFVSVEPHPRTVAVSARGKAEELAQVRDSDLKAYLDLSYVSQEGSYDFPVLLTLSDSASILNPLELKVTPEIVSLKVEEEVTAYADIIPLISGKPAEGYLFKSATVKPDQIAITGPKTMVENNKTLRTLNVSMSNAKTAFTSKVGVEKKGMFIQHDDIEVAVTVEIEQELGSRKFTKVPVRVLNIPPEFEIRAMTKEVTFTLDGSVVLLTKLASDQSFVTADASKIKEAGTYYLELSYQIPKSVKLSDGYTKSIPVTFAKKEIEQAPVEGQQENVVEDSSDDEELVEEAEPVEKEEEVSDQKTETKKKGWW